MKILITSGGTKIPIDLVRSITNMSRGTFGSKICDAFWKHIVKENPEDVDGKEITFFYAKNSRVPKAQELHNGLFETGYNKIRFIEFDTFDRYRDQLKDLLKNEQFDIICLAAAVSDYGVENVFDGKYRSTSEDMVIRLKKLPKVINEITELVPVSTCVCGFKLLVKSTDEQLREAMMKQLENPRIDMVIGNDLRDIKANDHTLTLKNKYEDTFAVYKKSMCDLPTKVVEECIRVWKLKNGNSIQG